MIVCHRFWLYDFQLLVAIKSNNTTTYINTLKSERLSLRTQKVTKLVFRTFSPPRFTPHPNVTVPLLSQTLGLLRRPRTSAAGDIVVVVGRPYNLQERQQVLFTFLSSLFLYIFLFSAAQFFKTAPGAQGVISDNEVLIFRCARDHFGCIVPAYTGCMSSSA